MFLTEEQFDLEAIAVLPLGIAMIAIASRAIVIACLKALFTDSKYIFPVIAYGWVYLASSMPLADKPSSTSAGSR